MSRLSIDISQEQHQQIKALAALQGKSIKDFILGKLFISNNEDEKAAMAELETLLLSRIQEAKTSSKTIEQITDDVLREDQP
jgi:hypothetical protein